MASGGGYDGGGGRIGGKIRRRLQARATPYSRPQNTLARPGETSGWISRIVDPASRLLAGGASRIFSSLFRKRLTAPPVPVPQPEQVPTPVAAATTGFLSTTADHHVGIHAGQETTGPAPNNTSSQNLDNGPKGMRSQTVSYEASVSELENMLLNKEFTRDEIDRLTKLLLSKTESQTTNAVVSNEEIHRANVSPMDTAGQVKSHAEPVPLDGINSPAELAKAYMNSRTSRGSSSALNLRKRISLENKAPPTDVVYGPRLSGGVLAQKSNEHGNVYSTPRSIGRSAMYRMSRSPYFKGPSSSMDIHPVPLLSHQTPTSNNSGGRQDLKRKNAFLDSDIGSLSSIKRIRQKANISSPFMASAQNPKSILRPGWSSIQCGETSKPAEDSNMQKQIQNDFPSRPDSNKIAQQIFMQLDSITQSPKDKLKEKTAIADEESLSKHSSAKPSESSLSKLGAGETSFKAAARTSKFIFPTGSDIVKSSHLPKEWHQEGAGATFPSEDSGFNFVDRVKSSAIEVAQTSVVPLKQGRPGFQMVAPEELLEMDDDHGPKEVLSGNMAVSATGKVNGKTFEKKIEKAISEQKTVSGVSEKIATVEKSDREPLTYQSKAVPLAASSDDEKDGAVVRNAKVDKDSDFTFPLAPKSHPKPSLPTTVSLRENEKSMDAAKCTEEALSAPATARAESKISSESSLLDNALSDGKGTYGKTNSHIILKNGIHDLSTSKALSESPFDTSSAGLSNGLAPSSSPKFMFSFATIAASDKPATALPSLSAPLSTTSGSLFNPSDLSQFPPAPTFNFGSSKIAAFKVPETRQADEQPVHSDQKIESASSFLPSTVAPVDSSRKVASESELIPSTTSIAASQIATSKASSPSLSFSTLPNTSATTPASSAMPFSSSSLGSNMFGFNASAQANGCQPNLSIGATSVAALDTKTFQSGTTALQSSQSSTSPFTFSTPSFGLGSSAFGKTTPVSASTTQEFSFSSAATTSSLATTSSPSTAPSNLFMSSPLTTSPIFGSSTALGASNSTGLAFGQSAPASSPFMFGGSQSAFAQSTSSGSQFMFGAPAAAPVFSFSSPSVMNSPSTASAFGKPNQMIGLSSSSPSNDQMNVEDSMVDDTNQVTHPIVPLFGQSTPVGSLFGASPLAPVSPPAFPFGAQQSPAPQNPSPFASPGVEFSGGSFSLGAGGGGNDKSGRRIIKVNRNKPRKK